MQFSTSFEKRLQSRSRVSSGDILDASTGTIDPALDQFDLHDSIVYKWEIFIPIDGEASIAVSGLLPNWLDVFDLHFLGVSGFAVGGVDLSRAFGVNQLKCKVLGNAMEVQFLGEFQGQSCSFEAKSGRFVKFRLEAPLSRTDLGWT